MTSQAQTPALASLEYLPYLDDNGCLSEEYQAKIGVYAVFDNEKVLQFIGYSRNIYQSLKQHLVRSPQGCYWFKVETVTRPSRTLLEEIKKAWIAENGSLPVGNGEEEAKWNKPLDVKPLMTEQEKQEFEELEEFAQTKMLKKIARRFEEEIKEQLQTRGVKMEMRFNPKLKEKGLLELK